MLNLTRIALCACLAVCSVQAQEDDMAVSMLKVTKDQPTTDVPHRAAPQPQGWHVVGLVKPRQAAR